MGKLVRRGAGAALAALLIAVPVLAKDKDSAEEIKSQIEALKQGQQEILKQLDEIKKLIQQPRPAGPMGPNVKDLVINLGDNPIRGSATAKLTMVEFTDYQ
jgi:protein-disulfide isomerase